MARILLFLLAIMIMLPSWAQAGEQGVARVRFIAGEAWFQTLDDNDWLPLTAQTPLDAGDAVWCPESCSKLEIEINDGSILRLDSDSGMTFIAVSDNFNRLEISNGRFYVNTLGKSEQSKLQLDADDTKIFPNTGTKLRVDLLANRIKEVSVFAGTANFEQSDRRIIVKAGELIKMDGIRNKLLALNPADDWDRWNRERDRSLLSDSSGSTQYLPEELKRYSGDFDQSGVWKDVPEYGMIWQPTIVAGVEWAPYRNGRWLWLRGDYVWVPYEKWGWVPYHYGRWVSVNGRWFWVPPSRNDVYWGPGYVGWYRSGDTIAWTPLAPRETYYGRGYYGKNSVNIVAGKTRINNRPVYQNARTLGGITVVRKNDFLKGNTKHQPNKIGKTAPVASISTGKNYLKPARENLKPDFESRAATTINRKADSALQDGKTPKRKTTENNYQSAPVSRQQGAIIENKRLPTAINRPPEKRDNRQPKDKKSVQNAPSKGEQIKKEPQEAEQQRQKPAATTKQTLSTNQQSRKVLNLKEPETAKEQKKGEAASAREQERDSGKNNTSGRGGQAERQFQR